jgi:hypothetical protein
MPSETIVDAAGARPHIGTRARLKATTETMLPNRYEPVRSDRRVDCVATIEQLFSRCDDDDRQHEISRGELANCFNSGSKLW